MPKFVVLFLIMVHALVISTMSIETVNSLDQLNIISISNRKLDKHRNTLIKPTDEAPHFSPSESYRANVDPLSPLSHQDPESGLTEEVQLKKRGSQDNKPPHSWLKFFVTFELLEETMQGLNLILTP